MADIKVSDILAEQSAKVPRDPTGAVARGLGVGAVIDARQEGLKLARGEPRLRVRVPEQVSITEYIDQNPKPNEDGRPSLSGGKYQVVFVPGDYFVKAEHVYFGKEERHWALRYNYRKVEFLCCECWIVEPDHAAGCPAIPQP